MSWSLPAERYDEIRSIVADFIEDWGIRVYPFSIWSLLRKIGIRTVPYSSLRIEERQRLVDKYPNALTLFPRDFDPLRTIIFYNDEVASRERIRFTLAHELGHLVLMHLDRDEESCEREADIFANYLLVPAPLVLESSSVDYVTVSIDFDVSYGCAASACDRAKKRSLYGPAMRTEYERRILDSCILVNGGGQLAPV